MLPDAVFARALASSVRRTLKVDPAATMAGQLPQGRRHACGAIKMG